jgi:hypothetical protein
VAHAHRVALGEPGRIFCVAPGRGCRLRVEHVGRNERGARREQRAAKRLAPVDAGAPAARGVSMQPRRPSLTSIAG